MRHIFLLTDGQVKILDFGLARSIAGTASGETRADMTDPGMVMGTVGYMAPEQVRGQVVDRGPVRVRRRVVRDSGRTAGVPARHVAETMRAILKEEPADLTASRAEIPPAIDRIVRHCLEKNPAERSQTARDVAYAAMPENRMLQPSS